MKQTKTMTCKMFIALLLVGFFNAIAIAQDSAVSSTTSTTTIQEHTWYTQPWVWVVGGAVLLLLIVALVRSSGPSNGNSTTDKVTYTKTTETDKT